MGAQLSRIGPGRSTLVVLVCAVLSLAGLVRSGLAGEADGNADSRDPVVLAPPKVEEPDLGRVEQVSRKPSAKKAATKAQRTKTCVTALGQKVKVPRDFECPKVQQLSTPNAKDLRDSGKVVPQQQTGGAPGAPQGTTPAVPTKTTQTTKPKAPAPKPGQPAVPPQTGGAVAPPD